MSSFSCFERVAVRETRIAADAEVISCSARGERGGEDGLGWCGREWWGNVVWCLVGVAILWSLVGFGESLDWL